MSIKLITAARAVVAIVGMVGVLQFATASAEQGGPKPQDDPKGNISVSTKTCEQITLNAPTGVKPAGATYQYYIDTIAAIVGNNVATSGDHTITLKVNANQVDTLVDTKVVKVDACEEEQPKVRICHATNSVTNPYENPTVDQNAVNGGGANDHSHHTGPIASSQAYAQVLKDGKQSWGDIIPPFDGYAGLNWSALGQKMWTNGCNFVPFTSFSWKCVESTTSFVATFTNEGGADSTVKVNDQTITLKPGETKDFTVITGHTSVPVKVTVDGTVVFDRGVACFQGQGTTGGGGTVSVLGGGGGQGAATGVASLPYTGNAAAQIASLVAVIASIGTAVGGYILRNRSVSSL